MPKVAIAGAGGFVGTALQKMFKSDGYDIISLKRADIVNAKKLTEILDETEILVNLSGASIIARWSESYKKELYDSRINTTKNLVNAIANVQNKPKLLISTSAVGIYSNDKNQTEDDFVYGDDFLTKVCKDWELEANKANNFGVRTVIFRFGIVMGKEGGAFAKMITPFRFGLGGNIGSGKQNFSFVHIEDLVRAYKFVYENENLSGVFNMVAPTPTTNEGLTKAISKAISRPAFLDVPEFVLRLIFGEGAKVLTDGQKVLPKRLLESGFEFKFDDIEKTIKDLTKD